MALIMKNFDLDGAIETAIQETKTYLEDISNSRWMRQQSDDRFYTNGTAKLYDALEANTKADLAILEAIR